MGRFCDLILDTVLFLRGFDRVSLFITPDTATPCRFHKGMDYLFLALICTSSNTVKPPAVGFHPRMKLVS